MSKQKKLSKFYVASGDLRFVGLAENEVDAIFRALETADKYSYLGEAIRVNQLGFLSRHKSDRLFSTKKIIRSIEE